MSFYIRGEKHLLLTTSTRRALVLYPPTGPPQPRCRERGKRCIKGRGPNLSATSYFVKKGRKRKKICLAIKVLRSFVISIKQKHVSFSHLKRSYDILFWLSIIVWFLPLLYIHVMILYATVWDVVSRKIVCVFLENIFWFLVFTYILLTLF